MRRKRNLHNCWNSYEDVSTNQRPTNQICGNNSNIGKLAG